MKTLDGTRLGVVMAGRAVGLVVGTRHHGLDGETALRLGHALVEASGGPPASAFVRSVVTRKGAMVTVDREPVGTGVRVLVGRPRSARQALSSGALDRSDAEPVPDEVSFDLSSADAGELALELLRTAAGLPGELTFAAWPTGAWLSERRRAGELERALAAAVRMAARRPAEQWALLRRVQAELGVDAAPSDVRALPASPYVGALGDAEDVDDFADELAELGCARAFALGLGDEAAGVAMRSFRDWGAPEIALYAAGRDCARGIAAHARGA